MIDQPCTCRECVDCGWRPFAARYQALVAAVQELHGAAARAVAKSKPDQAWHYDLVNTETALDALVERLEDWGLAGEAMIGGELLIQPMLPLVEVPV